MTILEQSIKSNFGIIDEAEIEAITELFELETIKKGDYFLKANRKSERMSFIKTGYLRLFVTTEIKEVTQWISSKGYFVTDLASFMLDVPARWNIQALTDVEVYTIRKSAYRNIAQLIPKWPELEKTFIVHCFTTMEERIFGHLSMSAEERYQYFFEHHSELLHQVPLQYIASMLGMTPETFSRIRKRQLG